MKSFLKLFFAAILGGLVVFSAGKYFDGNETVAVNGVKENWTKLTSNTSNNSVGVLSNAPQSFSLAAQKATPSVVHVFTSQSRDFAQRQNDSRPKDLFEYFFGEQFYMDQYSQRQEGAGSGVIISQDGYIVTNNHVVNFGDVVQVTLSDGRQFEAEKVGQDASTDLALLRIEATGLSPIEFGDSENVQVGDWVLAVGNPFSYLTSTVTAGIVSAKGRDINIMPENGKSIESFIQTDAAVNPGNSGGALVDVKGRLVGINTAIATPTGTFTGYSFAIPVNLMERIVDDIIRFGEYKKPLLGVTFTELNADVAERLEISETEGMLVREVVEGSSAEYAGILPNDVIKKIDGKKVNSSSDLLEKIASSKRGQQFVVEVMRKGKPKILQVQMKDS